MKKKLNIIRNKRGSALLVAMLVMGVLLSVSLALSTLVFRELRITKDLLASGKAYYAAESGIEVALLDLNRNLPGWEPGEDEKRGDDYVTLGVSGDANAEYSVNNRCRTYPCFDDHNIDEIGNDLQQLYGVLELNETLTIPLFIFDEDTSTEVPVGDFTVEFFTNFNPKEDMVLKTETSTGAQEGPSSWEVLRWKVYGLEQVPGEGPDEKITASINDKAAVVSVRMESLRTGDAYSDYEPEVHYNVTNAKQPSWFGSIGCSEGGLDRVTNNLDPENNIACIEDEHTIYDPVVDKVEGQQSKIFRGSCLPTQAREYYDFSQGEVEFEDIHPCYYINTFLDNHELNYLSITNMMNPSLLDFDRFGETQRMQMSRIFYRIEFFERGEGTTNEVVRDFADITSHGYSGNAKQSINVKMKKGSVMPVFNFAIYSTRKVD
ncbi:hypothetical protein ACFL21_01825 [Patescibacteria group bacterium]